MNVLELFAKIIFNSDSLDKGLSESEQKVANFGSKLKNGLSTAAKVGGAALTAAGTAAIALSKQAIDAYADYEQLVGGVETLFGTGGESLEEYAERTHQTLDQAVSGYSEMVKAQETVLQHADEAYKTAGLSANEYMETVTSFSASLIQSLGGDTLKAAEYADKAITDMSDNANKMGSDMSSIQTAYQGFAKQNYTMLDNLKLGYGGTKTEMERLVEDAEKLDSTFKATRDENGALTLSYADVVDAIHVVQTNMGITGTTAEEAEKTISGSLASMKAAWKNLLTGMASGGKDMDKLVDNLIKSAETVLDNILPVAERALEGLAGMVERIAPLISEKLPGIMQKILPPLLRAAGTLVVGLVKALPDIFKAVIDALPDIVHSLVDAFFGLLSPSAQEGLTQFGEWIQTAFGTVKEWFSQAWETISGVLQAGWQFVSDWFNTFWNEHGEQIKEAFRNIIDGLKQRWENFKENLTQIWEFIKSTAEKIWNGLKDFWETWGETIKTYFSDVWETIKSLFQTVLDAIVDLFSVFAALFKGDWEAAWEAVKTFFTDLWDNLKTSFENYLTTFTDLFENIWNVAKEKVSQIWETIQTGIDDAMSWLRELPAKALQWGRDLIQSFVNGIKEKISAVKDAIGNVAESVSSRIHFSEPDEGPLSDFHTYAPDMMRTFAKGIRDNKYLILDELNTLAGQISEGISYGRTRATTEAAQPINITVQSILDGKIIAQTVTRYQRNKALATGGAI